jgi:hypothetical protein
MAASAALAKGVSMLILKAIPNHLVCRQALENSCQE